MTASNIILHCMELRSTLPTLDFFALARFHDPLQADLGLNIIVILSIIFSNII